ncbi:MAG TPA: molybdopterin-dependent oxidoreductase [Anaerolineales bacterium]|nr:molybdopterin-dependent oxidoreductase [Anaerolineales bacterium]
MNGTILRFINTLILILFCVLGITGLYGLVWPFPASLFDIHRIAGWALILLIPWKTVIALRSLGRGLNHRLDRSLMIVVSILLTMATVTLLVLVLMWTWQIGPYYVWIGPVAYSGIGWHWGIALGLTPLFILHVWRRWPRPKKVDFAGRRQALKLMGFGAAAVATWGLSEALTKSMESTKAQRRFTGSREQDSFAGNAHPVTSGADQGRIKLDPDTWALRVTGAVMTPLSFTYTDLLALSFSEATATLDCTGGWYTVQTWQGIPLSDLLARAQVQPKATGILLRGVLDYSAPFTLVQAQEILLATHVGEEVLNHSHGFPLRAVVPSRRGWHWVKWLTEIQVIGAS